MVGISGYGICMNSIGGWNVNKYKEFLLYITIGHVIGVIYCAALLIYRPFGMEWGIAGVGIIFGVPNILYLSYLMVSRFINEKRELNKKYNEKTWIEKASEQKIG
jgi:hypothetical protein